MKHPILLPLLFALALLASCQSSSSSGDDDSDTGTDSDSDTDTDVDTDSDADTDEDWCPELETSCEEPSALENCPDDVLEPPRLIFPLSGRHIRDRRPEIIWEVADDVEHYRLEIARDRAFTDVVYRSADYEPYPDYDDRLHHIVSCDLDCGAHFFRVLSVIASDCEIGSASYTWEMFVGMAPGDLDRDGVPDIAYCKIEEPPTSLDPKLVRCSAYFDLDESGGQTLEPVKVVEFEIASHFKHVFQHYLGDVNGDSRADLGLSFVTDSIAYPDEALFEFFVFSGLHAGEVKSDADAIATIDHLEGLAVWVVQNTRYADFNGDGYSDIGFAEQIANIETDDFEQKLRVVLGGPDGSIVESLEFADVTVVAPESTANEWSIPSLGMMALWVDVNGDGFADLVSDAAEYDSGIGGAGYEHVVAVFGSTSPPAEMGLFEGTATMSGDSGFVIGEWEIGGGFGGASFPYIWLHGDVDFDGYPEIGSPARAVDSTASLPLDTGGYAIFDDILVPGISLASESRDFVFVGDFEIQGLDGNEKLGPARNSGSLNGDVFDDLLIKSSQHEESYPNYGGRWFYFWGREAWDDLLLASESDQILPPDEDYSHNRWIADIDGDQTPEKCTETPTEDSIWAIHLSDSGEIVSLACEDQGCLLPAYPDIY